MPAFNHYEKDQKVTVEIDGHETECKVLEERAAHLLVVPISDSPQPRRLVRVDPADGTLNPIATADGES